jgi:magnesium transporter
MIRGFCYGKEGNVEEIPREGADRFMDQAMKDTGLVLWLDMVRPSHEELDLLRDKMHFHPLAIEDCVHASQRPKVDDYGSYSFIVLYAVDQNNSLHASQIGIFLGPNYMVTVHGTDLKPVDEVMAKSREDPRLLQQGVDYILYRLLDESVDGYFPILNSIDEEVDVLEDEIMDSPSQRHLERIFSLKKDLVSLRKICAPQRDVVNILISREHSLINQESVMYYRDIYDHLIRVYDMIENLRDILTNAMEIYLSMVSNRLGTIMRSMTVVATIFMPITFITSFFGMNVELVYFLKAHNQGELFWWLIGIMLFLSTSMIWFFRKKGWI